MSGALSVAKKFGERLRYLRSLKSLTQSGLAELIGLSSKQVSRIERGISTPPFTILEKICQVLENDPVSFFLFTSPASRPGCPGFYCSAAQKKKETWSNEVLPSSKTGAWIIRSSQGTGSWSASLYNLMGYRPFSVKPTRKRFLKHVHPRDRSRVESFLRLAAEQPEEKHVLATITGKGLVQRMVMIQTVAINDDWGTGGRTLVIIREVTDCIALHRSLVHNQHQLEEFVLKRSKELARTVERLEQEVLERKKAEQSLMVSEWMVASSLDAQLFMDRNGVIRKVNAAYVRLAGTSAQELVGRKYSDVLVQRWGENNFRRSIKFHLDQSLGLEQEAVHQGWLDYESLGRRYMRVFLTPCRRNKECLGVVVTLHDLTDIMQVQESIQRNEELYRRILRLIKEGVL